METFDAIVIGTGFGGAVTACRLAQAGYKICVLERGRRYTSSEPHPDPDNRIEPSSDFPALPPPDRIMPDLARWRWSADQGLWDVRDLGDAHCVQAAGYGGGSLVYAGVHLRAPEEVFSKDWPSGYNPVELAPYYDLVASMLDIKPITEAPFDLIKTDQLKRVAGAIGQQAGLFHPPLAINFKRATNAFGVEQGACRACGECDTGCRYRAKNTLDLNYLALVEQHPNAQVRTLAEALLISPTTQVENGRYEVEYRDHLQGRERVCIAARAVFVCAGAVGTTELLLHCRAAAHENDGRGLPGLLTNEKLGQRLFLNADALGIVYDARSPEGGPRRVEATTGPVITTCITYRGDQGKPWFMLQDGGFPRALARHVGLMRAPIWLRRNRFGADAESKVPAVGASAAGLQVPTHVPMPVPLGDAGGITGGPLSSVVDGLLALLRDGELKRTVPGKVHDAFDTLHREITDLRDGELTAVVDAVRERLIEQRAESVLKAIATWWHTPAPWVGRAVRSSIRWLYDTFAERATVIAATTAVADARYDPRDLSDPNAVVPRATRYLLGFSDQDAEHSQHSMVLLAMGRDDAHGHLSLNEHGEAELKLKLPPRADVYATQERLMRDAASALSGRLRTSPSWAFGHKPLTVHGQGGCGMSSDPSAGVTDENGAVYGCEGLYVMDGSVIPTAVGVNPSSTIAAIAERNIRIFIARNPPSQPVPDWDKANKARAERWRSTRAAWRNPAGAPPVLLEPPLVASREPASAPIGVEFDEHMSGFLSMASGSAPPHGPAEYEAAELTGRAQGCSIELDLTATVRDIGTFIADSGHQLKVSGHARLRGFAGPGSGPEQYNVVKGEMDLFPGADARARREMQYRLHLMPSSGTGPSYEIKGTKHISDDAGPDAWRDTTALYVTATAIEASALSPPRHGVLHVALDQFLYEQMKSYRALGTDDPARMVWAVSAFVAYFFGTLQRVYLPQLGRATEVLSNIKLR